MSPLDITDLGENDWIRMVLYSYPGWGKTSFEATSGYTGRTLIVRSHVDLIPSRALKMPNCQQVIANTHEKMDEVLNMLRLSDHPYEWVWWDNISTAQDVLLDDVWEAVLAEKPGRGYLLDQQGRSTGKPNLTPSSGLDRGEYGRNAERIQQWVRHMVGCASFHFGIGAHPFEGPHPTNDEGGDLLKPWVQVKHMADKICGYGNMVGFLELVEEDDKKFRRLHFQESPRFYAKDQYDAFPNGYIDNPDIATIMAAVEKARGKKLNHNGTKPVRGTTTPSRGTRGQAKAAPAGRRRGAS